MVQRKSKMETIGKSYRNKRVLITGHTGFKGSWLCMCLHRTGAKIYGISKNIPTNPSLYNILNIKKILEKDYRINIEDYKKTKKTINEIKPDVIFHLAGQSLVSKSYNKPLETFRTNTLGTLNILDITYLSKKKINIILITSDKVYKNLETNKKYKENDIIGGDDPYSGSKGAADIIANSYKHLLNKKKHKIIIARAGNVIGGGDWAENRIIADCYRSWINKNPVKIRNPNSTRPWQHVLEPISGYLLAGSLLLKNKKKISGNSFNFGPRRSENKKVKDILDILKYNWNGLKFIFNQKKDFNEHKLLQLSSEKANKILNWKSILSFRETISLTSEWYTALKSKKNMREYTFNQINYYERKFNLNNKYKF